MQGGLTNPAVSEVMSYTEVQMSPGQGDLVSVVRQTSLAAFLAAPGKGRKPGALLLPAGRGNPAAPARRSAFHRC